jgi:protein-tyrosine phosphatase
MFVRIKQKRNLNMSEIIKPNPVTVDGVINVRDLGGYPVKDGRMRSGRLLRGAELSTLTAQGQQQLAQYPVGIVIDMRTDAEIEPKPDILPEGAQMIHLDVMAGQNLDPIAMLELLKENDGATLMRESYRVYVTDATAIEAWRQFFQLLLNQDDNAIYYHCTAGKDRTGIATALVLFALGAKHRVVMADYLLSNVYREVLIQQQLEQIQALMPDVSPESVLDLLVVREDYLETLLTTVDENYGDMDNFLSSALGIGKKEREQLKSMLVI